MANVLGHDIDGRPLRFGDEVTSILAGYSFEDADDYREAANAILAAGYRKED